MATLTSGISSTSDFAQYFKDFDLVNQHDDAMELCEFFGATNPHTNPYNNGLIIFPVSGTLTLNTYSYLPPAYNPKTMNRASFDFKNMSEQDKVIVTSSLVDSVDITSPMVIDGLTTYSLQPKSGTTSAIVLVLKIPMIHTWEDIAAAMTPAA
jgi:hypothetical protein